ncbi:MAG: phosphoribosylglycinamide formyltransferase 2, partial [Pseudomonadales bacterium]
GLPIPLIEQLGPAASAVILGEGTSDQIAFEGVAEALDVAGTDLRLFGKPSMAGSRRLGVALARSEDLDQARSAATQVASQVQIILGS